jgi:hypothetical protein
VLIQKATSFIASKYSCYTFAVTFTENSNYKKPPKFAIKLIKAYLYLPDVARSGFRLDGPGRFRRLKAQSKGVSPKPRRKKYNSRLLLVIKIDILLNVFHMSISYKKKVGCIVNSSITCYK